MILAIHIPIPADFHYPSRRHRTIPSTWVYCRFDQQVRTRIRLRPDAPQAWSLWDSVVETESHVQIKLIDPVHGGIDGDADRSECNTLDILLADHVECTLQQRQNRHLLSPLTQDPLIDGYPFLWL